jgi:S-DNA-T family DNA segregation ATPase FtsK/SpoIIIE
LTFSEYVERALREGAMWTLMCVALYLVLSLASYAPEDPGWSYVGETAQVTNAGGPTGAWFADVTLYLFGFFAYLLPLMLGFSAWVVFRGREEEAKPRAWMLAVRWIGFLATLAAGCGYATMHFAELGSGLPNGTGGGLGHLVSDWMLQHFSGSGTEILLAGVFLVGFTLFSGISWLALLQSVGDGVLHGLRLLWSLLAGGLGGLFSRRDPDRVPDLPPELNLINEGESAVAPQRPTSIPEVLFHPGEADAGPSSNRRQPLMEAEQVMTLSDIIKGQRSVPKEAPRVKKARRTAPVPDSQMPLPQLAGAWGRWSGATG